MKKHTKIKLISWIVFLLILCATLVAGYFAHFHSFFELDGKMFFHAWFGFSSCIIMILFSKILGLFLKRGEGYYKEDKNE